MAVLMLCLESSRKMYFLTLRNARLFLSACTDVSVLQYELFLVAYVTIAMMHVYKVISQFASLLDGISRYVFFKFPLILLLFAIK